MAVEIVAYPGYLGVCAAEYGYVFLCHAFVEQSCYAGVKLFKHFFIVCTLSVRLYKRAAHIASFLAFVSGFLFHICIDVFQYVFACVVADVSGQQGYDVRKNVVVEVYNLLCTPVIGVELFETYRVDAVKFVFHPGQNAPVSVSPPVYGLFHVSHDETVVSSCKAFGENVFQYAPLHDRCVLEFIYHYGLYHAPCLFVDE